MNILTALRDVQRIYLDTAPLIYLVEKRLPSAAKMDWIVNQIETTPLEAFSAVLTLTEVMVQPLRMDNTDLAQEYHDLLVHSSDYKLVSVTADIAVSEAAIRARYHLRTPDALHATTAIAMDCDAFLTNDTDFRRIQDLNVHILDDLEL